MLLEKIKLTLRIDDNTLDADIQDTIEAAKLDLRLRGVSENKITEEDALIIRAIKTYCKAEYSSDDKEADRYTKSYEMLRDHLTMSIDYNTREQL